MSGGTSGGDKTEKPTPKRKRDARREGRIPRSPEIVSWAGLLAATVLVPWGGRIGASGVRELVARSADEIAAGPDPDAAAGILGAGLRTALLATAPLAVGLMLVAIATNVAQVGLSPSAALLKPKMSRVNPWAGLKRLLSPATTWEAGKSVAKLAILAWLVHRSVTSIVPALVDGGRLAAADVAAIVGGRALGLARQVAIAGLLLAAVDYGYQRRRIGKTLRMTKQEIKDEHRQSEGDPMLRGQIRSKQLAVSRNRMMAAVATADVVIVNPIHVAVALRYDATKGPPRVVAKGAGAVAARIREEADRNRVPMVTDIPLARTIHRSCELGDAIPAELYDAVARVLAFVFSLRARR